MLSASPSGPSAGTGRRLSRSTERVTPYPTASTTNDGGRPRRRLAGSLRRSTTRHHPPSCFASISTPACRWRCQPTGGGGGGVARALTGTHSRRPVESASDSYRVSYCISASRAASPSGRRAHTLATKRLPLRPSSHWHTSAAIPTSGGPQAGIGGRSSTTAATLSTAAPAAAPPAAPAAAPAAAPESVPLATRASPPCASQSEAPSRLSGASACSSSSSCDAPMPPPVPTTPARGGELASGGGAPPPSPPSPPTPARPPRSPRSPLRLEWEAPLPTGRAYGLTAIATPPPLLLPPPPPPTPPPSPSSPPPTGAESVTYRGRWQRRSTHFWRLMYVPPNLGLSRQLPHSPQSSSFLLVQP